jgi:hypothetical protein
METAMRTSRRSFHSSRTASALLAWLALFASLSAVAQVKVVDMIPPALSDETHFDGEPYVTVNPANPRLIAATAFMLTPAGSPNGPLLVSTDGGATWATQNVIPSSPGGLNTFDVTIRFNSAGTAFYAALLRDNTVDLEIQRTTDLAFGTPLLTLNPGRATDQPYIFAQTVVGPPDAGQDRLWVGNNDGAASPASATVDQTFDASALAPVFAQARIDAGAPVARDNYQVRTTAHSDGHVYAAFYRRRGNTAAGYNADVVVVRDDDWGRPIPPFRNLLDAATLTPGQNVVLSTPVSDTFGSSTALGREWWGGDLYLFVDPQNSARVYISYSDSRTGSDRTLHLRRSTDFGQTWSTDLLTTPSAKNAAIAINGDGTIGYLYQQLAGPAGSTRWQTHLQRSNDGATWDDLTLADFPAEGAGSLGGSRIIGDYLNMVAVGRNFYGVFSSNNDRVNALFPQGVTYLRNTTPSGDPAPRLLGVDGVTIIAPSIDPFFFVATPPQPQIQVPGDLDLGATCGGATGGGKLDVCNTGKADLVVSSISSSSPQFTVTPPSAGFPVTISHDFCFPFQVRFTPTGTGPQTATLTIASNDPDHPSTLINVAGTGTERDVRVAGSTDFGVTSAWSPAEKTVSVCNVGSCDLTVSSAAAPCSEFALAANPFPATLRPGACLDLGVRFTPRFQGLRTCDLNLASDDPDSPLVSPRLRARTPPSFSLHGGVVFPHGALHAAVTQGSAFHLDFLYPVRPRVAWDVRLGRASFDGRGALPDVDVSTLSADARFTLNPAGPIRAFLNGGIGAYHFDPGKYEGGANLGLGFQIPAGSRLVLELTYNHHWALTASPTLRFSEVQAGLLIPF